MTDTRPFQPFHDRLAGRPLDTTLHDGVPEWLEHPLREWLEGEADEDLVRRMMIRLHWPLDRRYYSSYKEQLRHCQVDDLLTVVDAVIQLHEVWGWYTTIDGAYVGSSSGIIAGFKALDFLLAEAGSLYRVDLAGHCLVRRVDPTVEAATDAALKTAPSTAGDHLLAAWTAAYGLSPDPDKVFNEAIRAVEEVACPLVEGKKAAKNVATLGTVIGELKNSGHVWELVLPAKDGSPRDVASIVSLMETLWEAQVSRHGGAPKARRQTQEEAEAAVHLGVLLVQWLTTGVLRKRKP